jgi:hypothetical protein
MSDGSPHEQLEPLGRHEISEEYDNPIERLRLIAGDDDAVAGFLDEIDVRSPREREMLSELARRSPLARPERFAADHRRVIEALESLRRHGFHGSRAASMMGPFKFVVRKLIELIARYLVVSYVKNIVTTMRNLYWVREMEALDDSVELKLLRPARFDAQGLVQIMQSREIGVPSFVFAGLLIPLVASIWRIADGFSFDAWWVATLVGLAAAAVGVGLSWIVLRGTAMASRRIRLALDEPLHELWRSIGNCGQPPRDQSRSFAFVSISLMVGVWIVLPTLVAIALAT